MFCFVSLPLADNDNDADSYAPYELEYYYAGPMLSDLVGLEVMFKDIRFELGEPLLPFEQLMGCLPPASSILVPAPYRRLMTEPDSPIIQFYPTDFAVDMNGKK